MLKYLIAGLGNMGAEYAGTRHNIGFDIVDAFALKHEASFRIDRHAEIAELKWRGKGLLLLKPTTFMNLSGKAVKYWLDKEKIPQDRMLVIVDELALPLNKIRLRKSGSDGGHNGLKSIQEYLGNGDYPRLRFGIGNEYPRGSQVNHVLSPWRVEELPLVKLKIDKCVEVIESFLTAGIERTMSDANKMEFNL